MALDMRLLPFARIMYSLPRRVSFKVEPSGAVVSPSNCRYFTCLIPLDGGAYSGCCGSAAMERHFILDQFGSGDRFEWPGNRCWRRMSSRTATQSVVVASAAEYGGSRQTMNIL